MAVGGTVPLQADGPVIDGNSSETGNTTGDNASDTSSSGATPSATGGIAGGNASGIAGGNSSGNASDGGSSGGGGLIGGFGPSPTEWAVSVLTGLINRGIESFEGGIDRFTEEGIGIPAPGEPGNMDSWSITPSGPVNTWGDEIGGYWSGAIPAHFISALFGMIWLMFQSVRAGSKGPKERREMYKRIGIATVMILCGHHLIAPFALHAFNEWALELAPSGADFTGSIGDLARLGIGVVFGAILMVISSFVFVLGLISIELTDVLVYILYSVWGLMWAGWASAGQARAYGQQGVFTFGAMLALAPLQAIVLFMIFNISWTGSIADPITVLIGTSAGLAIAFIYLPWTFLKQTVMGAATALGAGAALASTQIDAALEEHVFERQDQYQEENESYTEDRPSQGDAPSTSSGGISSPPSGPAYGGGGGRSPPPTGAEAPSPADQYLDEEQDRVDYYYH